MIHKPVIDIKRLLKDVTPSVLTLAFCVSVPFASLHAAAAMLPRPVENACLPGKLAELVDKLPKSQATTFRGEHPLEDQMIELALLEQGYFRTDVPLSYAFQDALHTSCIRHDIDYSIALGLIDVESGFDVEALNLFSGCYGLMQLNPKWFPSGLPPEANIECGLAYLREQIDRYEDLESGLQAYHDGHDTGARWYSRAVFDAAEKWRRT